MFLARWLAVAAVLLVPIGLSAQQAPPSAGAVLAAAKEASGGAAWDSFDGALERGTHGTAPYRTWMLFRRYGFRMESGAGEAVRIHGFNGRTDWTMAGSRAAPIALGPAMRAETITTAYFTSWGFFFPDRFPATFRTLADQSQDDRAFDVVEVTPGGGRPVELWFDRSTHLLARIVDREGQPAVSVEASDYRPVGPLLIPFGATLRTMDGTVVDRGQIESIEFGAVDPRLLDPPAAPPGRSRERRRRH